ncbi:MAG: lipid-A-disaccharide synthase [Rubripirellula sp.]|nr:lipid-A-disaccharide synthase [Rubripirellula sp.]
MSRTIFFSAGEPSGDQHAAKLIQELRKIDSDFQFRGFGGESMLSAGCELDVDLTQHAVMGFVEVLPKLRQFFRFADQASHIFKEGKTDAVVLVDFPGFNWHIAKAAKKHRIPVYYYCPPQLWAWGGWRIRKMRRWVDHVLAVLPIEETFFASHGIRTTYVGHPFFDAVYQADLNLDFLTQCRRAQQKGTRLVAVLPGSRGHEVHRNWPIMLQAIHKIHSSNPQVKFLVAAYRESHVEYCREYSASADQELPIEFWVGKTSEIIKASECAMMVSGSVSLELMARKTPAVVTYRIGRVFHHIAKHLVNLDSFTLPNLMAGEEIYPEMISVGDAEPTVEMLATSIGRLLNDPTHMESVVKQLDELASRYASPGASRNAAECITRDLNKAMG